MTNGPKNHNDSCRIKHCMRKTISVINEYKWWILITQKLILQFTIRSALKQQKLNLPRLLLQDLKWPGTSSRAYPALPAGRVRWKPCKNDSSTFLVSMVSPLSAAAAAAAASWNALSSLNSAPASCGQRHPTAASALMDVLKLPYPPSSCCPKPLLWPRSSKGSDISASTLA